VLPWFGRQGRGTLLALGGKPHYIIIIIDADVANVRRQPPIGPFYGRIGCPKVVGDDH
jgi:hypothetical protein